MVDLPWSMCATIEKLRICEVSFVDIAMMIAQNQPGVLYSRS
jgi:hypothetical protein